MVAASIREEARHYEVVVLGAGMSGLACASRLYEHQHFKGKNRLLVLEARDRIGGRIESVKVNGCQLDTGANWIHGIGTKDKPNPLMNILPHKRYKQLSGVVAFSAPTDTHDDRYWQRVESVGSLERSLDSNQVIPAETTGDIMAALWGMIEALHAKAVSTSPTEAKATTMLDVIKRNKELREAFKRIPEQYHLALGSMPQFVEVMEAAPLAAQSAEHEKAQAGLGLLEFAIDDFDGDQVFLQDGYIQIVEKLASDLMAAGLVNLDTEVQRIDWSSKPIRVETIRGVISADTVACTFPLGVLQNHSKPLAGSEPSLFQPQLPANKLQSIQNLGFGTLDKIFLVYNEAWWTQEPWISIWKHGLANRPLEVDSSEDGGLKESEQTSPDSFMGFTDELAGIQLHQDGTSTTGPRLLSIMNLQNLTDQPVLSCFVSCANALQVEAMSDAQAGGIVHRSLTRWLGKEPPKPDVVQVTKWSSDVFSRGSYSHMIKGLSENEHRAAFHEPILNPSGGVLRFAGEHTDLDHFATAHGALISGWREADAILKGNET